MYGCLKVIRMFVLHPELQNNGLLTTLRLWTADFINAQNLTVRIVIYTYSFNGTSWTDATKTIGRPSHEMQKRILDACIEWDKKQML